MAGSIPPLVSSTPPPLCAFDDDEEEEEDEFGMYTAAEDMEYNECISFKEKIGEKQGAVKCRGEQDSTSQDSATDSGLCPDSEGVSPTPHSDEERTVKQSASNLCEKLYQQPTDVPTLGDRLNPEGFDSSSGFSALTDIPNGHVTAEDSVDDFGNFENFEHTQVESVEPSLPSEEDRIRELKLTEHADKEEIISEDLNLEEVNDNKVFDAVNDEDVQFEKHKDVSTVNEMCSDLENQEISDGVLSVLDKKHTNDSMHIQEELEASIEDCPTSNAIPMFTTEQNKEIKPEFDQQIDEFDDFTDFKADFSNFNIQNTEQSDNVSEHFKPISEQTHLGETVVGPTSHNDASDDEFSDFTEFSSSDCAFVSAQRSNSVEQFPHIPISDNSEIRTDSEFQDWVSVFPSSGSDCSVHDRGEVVILGDNDSVWSRLIPMESSPALSYQWAESHANRHLLTALNIDSRNILMKPWMPRFAANLSCGPLQPVKALEPLQPTPAPTAPPPVHLSSGPESVPDAHFDWVGSGLTNPLDCPKSVLKQHKALSAEAETILSSLPDLSFMRKSYIDFPINKG